MHVPQGAGAGASETDLKAYADRSVSIERNWVLEVCTV
jgi:hypothetical protein